MSDLVAALDIGTSSVRAILFDSTGAPVPGGMAHRVHQPHVSPEGEATLDADALVDSTLDCLKEVGTHAAGPPRAVAAATFWHSALGVDSSGRACTPVYLWSDTRSSAQVEWLRAHLDEKAVHARTGCLFHTSYLPARLLWVKEHEPDRFRAAKAWMSPGEYLHFRLFGERRCSFSMASGTGLLNQRSLEWDSEVLEVIGLSPDSLSPLVDIDRPFTGDPREGLAARFKGPWYPSLGDGACSNVGSGGVRPDRVTLMVGTSGAMRLLTPGEHNAPWGLWKYRLDRKRTLIGGALSNGGAVYNWLNQTLRLPPPDRLEQDLAESAPDSHGLTVLPFLYGERSPDWYSQATGAILGLMASTTPEQITRASLEAIAYRFVLVHRLLAPLADPDHVLVGSGAALAHSPAFAQILTDAVGRPMVMIEEAEGTARGAALMALEQLGLLSSLEAAPFTPVQRFEPDPARHETYASAVGRHVRLAQEFVGSFHRVDPERGSGGR